MRYDTQGCCERSEQYLHRKTDLKRVFQDGLKCYTEDDCLKNRRKDTGGKAECLILEGKK